MDENKGVIIDLDESPKEDSPRIANLKKQARRVVLGGAALAATATGIGLTQHADQVAHKGDRSSEKPIPALVTPAPTPDLSIPSTAPQILTSAQLDEMVEKNTPHLDFANFLKLSKEDQEKVIAGLKGVTATLIIENADSLNLNYDSDDEYGNKILVDSQSKDGLPIQFVQGPGEYEYFRKNSVNNNSDVNFSKGTRLMTLVFNDQHSSEPGIRLAALQKLAPRQP